MTERMTERERRLWDATAEHEAWVLAIRILEPWVDTTEAIGSEELTIVMNRALAEALDRRDAAAGKIEELKA
jgi:hypothetical protein